jgi:Ca2+-binding RTX toxin-like protein
MSSIHTQTATDHTEADSGLHTLDTIVGTDGPDTIIGTDAADTIVLGNGNDFVDAGNGNDTVIGGAGDDEIHGGDGNDILLGDDAGSGNGNDIIFGDNGDDQIVGGVGNNQLHGGSGDDFIFAGQIGGDQSGTVDGINTLFGDEGNDHLFGDDTLTGGDGADTFIFNTATEGVEKDTITDFHSGQDVVDLNGVGADFDVMAHLSDTADGATLVTDTGQTIVFAGEHVADLHAADFHLG